MSIAVAIIIGALVGVAGFIPTFKLARYARKMMVPGNMGALGLMLLSIAISFIVMIVAIAICNHFAKDVILPFVIALLLGLVITAIVYGIRYNRK